MNRRDIPLRNEERPVEQDPAPVTQKRGRPFEKGNGGRKPGSQNRATLVASALVEAKESALLEKSLSIALAGDTQMLRFLLDRRLPKEPPIHLELPRLRTVSDAVEALAIIAQAVAEGKISPSQGAAVSSITDRFTRAVEFTEISKKAADLQEKLYSDLALLKEQIKSMAS
jgi:hypothetical protein